MLRVPALRQPDDVTCLPTCIRAVLGCYGHRISDEQAAALCRTESIGSLLGPAVDGLIDAGLGAEVQQFAGIDELAEVVAEGQPVIVVLRHPSGGGHAVVACDLTSDSVIIMDPALGEHATIPIGRFEMLWCPMHNEGLLIGRRQP